MKLEVTYLKGLRAKSIGLIGSKRAYPILLKTRFGIHTFGLSFPIDVVILNKIGVVVKLVKSLAPNNILFWNPLYDTVVELPAGAVKRKGIKLGTILELLFSSGVGKSKKVSLPK